MSNISHSHSLSSNAAVFTLAAATVAIAILPAGFSLYPASYQALIFMIAAILLSAYFLTITFRRRQLYLNVSPLTLPLVFFALCLVFAILIQHGFHSTKSFLGLGGLLIASCLAAICSSILVKLNNSQIAIRATLVLVTASAITAILAVINSFTHTFRDTISGILYTPGLNLSLMFIGLAAIGANFFKKNKFKRSHLFCLPVITLGLIASLYLDFQAKDTLPSFIGSILTTARQITANGSVDTKTLIFGSQAQIYADIYDQFAADSNPAHLGAFYQSKTAPLTIMSLYGGLCTLAWLILIIRTISLCFSSQEANRDLYFVLLVSYFVQLFTAIHPLILMIQVILITFATNKNRQILFNLNMSTFSSQNNTQKVENRDRFRLFITSFSTLAALLLTFLSINLLRNYRGFYLHERALNDVLEDNISDYLEHANAAVRQAPDIDAFNRDAAIANVELMLQTLNDTNSSDAINERALGYYEQAVAYAQKAIAIEPTHANNYYVYAQILQEAYPHLSSQADLTTQASQINTAYATAALYQPQNADILLGLGSFHQGVGQYDSALEIYQSALRINPESAQANYQLATLYEQQNEADQAKTAYTNTLRLLDESSPEYQEIQAKLQALE